MAVNERKGQQIGSSTTTTYGNTFGFIPYTKSNQGSSTGDYTGSLLDFNVLYKGNRVTGTYNPSQGGGSSAVTQNSAFVESAKDLLSQDMNFSLGSANRAVGQNTSDNPFFGEFFNYYLGLAQERQAALQKNLSKGDLLSGGTSAASMVGGSLL